MHLTDAAVLQGEICDIDGKCVDAAEDELFKLTTKEGKIAVEREVCSIHHVGCLLLLQTCLPEASGSKARSMSSVAPGVVSLTLACR